MSESSPQKPRCHIEDQVHNLPPICHPFPSLPRTFYERYPSNFPRRTRWWNSRHHQQCINYKLHPNRIRSVLISNFIIFNSCAMDRRKQQPSSLLLLFRIHSPLRYIISLIFLPYVALFSSSFSLTLYISPHLTPLHYIISLTIVLLFNNHSSSLHSFLSLAHILQFINAS